SVKVDREERPDIDDVYMKAVQMLTGRGGWPMTVFLTPRGEPFYGGTYFPPTDRHGLPGFPRVLHAVARAYHERPEDVARSVEQIPRLYLEAYQVTGESSLRRVVEHTLDYVLRDMRHPEGGFFSATDADSEGEEGRYFVWTPSEVAAVVDAKDVELVCRYWDISPEG